MATGKSTSLVVALRDETEKVIGYADQNGNKLPIGRVKSVELTASRTVGEVDDATNFYSKSASALTVTVPAGMPKDFGICVTQKAAGQVTIAAGAGVTITNKDGFTKTAAQHAMIGIVMTDPDVYTLVGSGAV